MFLGCEDPALLDRKADDKENGHDHDMDHGAQAGLITADAEDAVDQGVQRGLDDQLRDGQCIVADQCLKGVDLGPEHQLFVQDVFENMRLRDVLFLKINSFLLDLNSFHLLYTSCQPFLRNMLYESTCNKIIICAVSTILVEESILHF